MGVWDRLTGKDRKRYHQLRDRYHWDAEHYEIPAIFDEFELWLHGGDFNAHNSKKREIAELLSFKYAEARASSETGFDPNSSWWTRNRGTIVSFGIVAIAVVLTIATAGSTATFLSVALSDFTLSLAVGTALSVSANFAMQIYQEKEMLNAIKSSFKEQMQERENEVKKADLESEKNRARLSASLIFGGYEIFANGAVFNKDLAGKESFKAQISPDSSRGIRGEASGELWDDYKNNRQGKHLAGGSEFLESVLNLEIPLAKIQKINENDAIQITMQNRQNKLTQGYARLGQYIYSQEHANIVSDLQKKDFNFWLRVSISRRAEIDTLEKIKNYNLGKRGEVGLSVSSILNKISTKNFEIKISQTKQEFLEKKAQKKEFMRTLLDYLYQIKAEARLNLVKQTPLFFSGTKKETLSTKILDARSFEYYKDNSKIISWFSEILKAKKYSHTDKISNYENGSYQEIKFFYEISFVELDGLSKNELDEIKEIRAFLFENLEINDLEEIPLSEWDSFSLSDANENVFNAFYNSSEFLEDLETKIKN